ncbi:MAG: RagB/SusD family nutrient uptake outer membrane protein [Bacteroidales bacterium]
MKTKLIFAAVLVLLMTACSEEFLSLPSREDLTTAEFFQSQSDFEFAVNGIYAPIREWYGPNTDVSTSPLFITGDIHSDNARYALNPNYRATQAVETPADFIPEQTLFSGYWNTFYQWISRCNQVIGNIDDVDFDAEAKANLKGQALFLRSHSYWWLLRLYGQAVLQLDPVTTLDQTSKPLSSEAEVKAQIIADASDAASMLPGKADQEAGRVTSGAAYMLLADVHMWYGEWAEAEAALNNVTGYSLLTDYAEIYDPANKNHAESIWEIQYSSASADYASSFVYNMFPYPFDVAQVEMYTGVSNPIALTSGEMFCVPTPELLGKYEVGDLRLDASVMYVDDANGLNFPMCIKYMHPHSTFRQSNDNLPIYRYAETLLYLAEAINEQGGRLGVAQGHLNEVRNRAGLPNTTAATQEELRQAILDERQVEFAMEGKRWWDLVRTESVDEVIGAYGSNVKADPESYYFPAGYETVPSAFTNIATTFNLPDDEIRLNSEID